MKLRLPFSSRAQPFDVPMKGQKEVDDDQVPCVPFVPFACPFCHATKPRTHKVRGRLRQHQCQRCRRHYRSYELGPDSVTRWLPPPDPGDPVAEGPHGGPDR